jgi:hypothetical protein
MTQSFDATIAPNGPNATATDVLEVTPDDGTDLAVAARGFYAEVGGDIKVTTLAGAERVIPVGAFQFIPCAIVRVWATGTTATGIVVLIK